MLRASDIEPAFLAALDAMGPSLLKDVADWINAIMPLADGKVKSNGTLGRTRDELAKGAIEGVRGRYQRVAAPHRIILERDTRINGVVYPAGEYVRR